MFWRQVQWRRGAKLTVNGARAMGLWASNGMVALLWLCASTGWAASEPDWRIDHATTPEHFSLCEQGQAQSPINFQKSMTIKSDAADLRFDYHAGQVMVVHRGHTLEMPMPTGNLLWLGNSRYTLVSIDLHSPSEHRFNNESYPLEVHLVHQNATGGLAVVALFFDFGLHQAALEPFLQSPPLAEGEVAHWHQPFNPKRLLPPNSLHYRYLGSLTTPPCAEEVKWFVLRMPRSVSEEQVERFQTLVNAPNNRPVQPLNDRTILSQ